MDTAAYAQGCESGDSAESLAKKAGARLSSAVRISIASLSISIALSAAGVGEEATAPIAVLGCLWAAALLMSGRRARMAAEAIRGFGMGH